MSSDAQQDQIQIIKYQKHLKWNLVSRSSDSGQNCKVSEASEHEVKSRSSDSEQMSSVNSGSYQRHQKQEFSRYTKTLIRIVNHDEVTFKPS